MNQLGYQHARTKGRSGIWDTSVKGVVDPAASLPEFEAEVVFEPDLERVPCFKRFNGLVAFPLPLVLVTGLTAGRYDSSCISTSSELLLEVDIDADDSRRLRLGIRPDFVGAG